MNKSTSRRFNFIEQLRFWLIRALVGHRVVLANLELTGVQISYRRPTDSLVFGCHFDTVKICEGGE